MPAPEMQATIERIVGKYHEAEEALLDAVADEFFLHDLDTKIGTPEEAEWRARLDTIATVSPELARQIEWYCSRLAMLRMLHSGLSPKPATVAPDEQQ